MLTKNLKIIAITLTMLLSWSMVAPAAKLQTPEPGQSYKPVSNTDGHPVAAPEAGDYIIQGTDDGAVCRDATLEESQALAEHDQIEPLHIISPIGRDEISAQDAGLTIILRGTQQLENFPQAKNAFLRAAHTWEAVIRSAITVIIDVDYGPTRFGQPYPNPNILGSTGTQPIGGTSLYPAVRSRLLSKASSPTESNIYNALPVGAVPTDIGSTAAVQAPSAVLRALGVLGSVADPTTETATLGPPPAIGFNSAFQFDFDPSDGIDAGKTDFDAVAVHELGHALGFDSTVGTRELFPGSGLSLSLLDLLRFRPGITLATFPTASRILSSGGAQVFFAGGSELPLSTGRPDSTGGDGRQPSHWKDDALTGQYLGIMDPTLASGERKTITNNDLFALDAIGYQVGAAEGGTTTLTPGVAQPGSIPAPSAGSAVLGATQYAVQVPNGASQLTIDLNGNQDVDLYIRFGQRIAIGSSGPVADHISDSPTGIESSTITPSSSPALRGGTYYVAVANYGPGAASFNVEATITSGAGGNTSPVINSLQAELEGDDLTLTGMAADPEGDIVQAQSDLLDGVGQVVGHTDPFAVSFGSSTTIAFSLTVNNLNAIPAAVRASLTFIDRRGNRSAVKTADFSNGDAGGPTLSNASYQGNKLIIKGGGFANQVLIEINGRVVSIIPSASDKKVKIKGTLTGLNLRSGANRLRVLNGDLRSNIFLLNL
jgi:hypothetical protein